VLGSRCPRWVQGVHVGFEVAVIICVGFVNGRYMLSIGCGCRCWAVGLYLSSLGGRVVDGGYASSISCRARVGTLRVFEVGWRRDFGTRGGFTEGVRGGWSAERKERNEFATYHQNRSFPPSSLSQISLH